MRVDEAMIEELRRRGVTCTFSVPSAEVMILIADTEIQGMKSYRTHHENAAIGMADGYARASGDVGVAIVGKGPGLTNAINALLTAARGPAGVLVLTGEGYSSPAADPRVQAGMRPSLKSTDQQAFLAALGVATVRLDSAETAVADMSAAFDLAASGTTVVARLCEDIGQLEAGTAPSTAATLASLVVPQKPVPSGATAEEIELIADLLGESWAAGRPVILAGRGAVYAGAKDELVRLGDSIGALFTTSIYAKGMFAGHPADIGLSGTMSTGVATEMLSRSDIVLAFGASLNLYTTFSNDLFSSARIIRVDSTEAAMKRGPKADIAIVGDARIVAKQLADEMERRGSARTGYRTPDVLQRIATSVDPLPSAGTPGALNPRLVSELVNRVLPANRAIVYDNGAHFAYGVKHFTASAPEAYFITQDYGAVGAGQPIALGVAVAWPDRTTVFVTGDGGFMASLADLDMASRYKLPIIFVVLNDSALSAEVHHLRMLNLPDDIARYDNPPLDVVGRAVGTHGIVIHRVEDLADLGDRLAALDGPVVIDCQVSIDPTPDYMGIVHKTHFPVPLVDGKYPVPVK